MSSYGSSASTANTMGVMNEYNYGASNALAAPLPPSINYKDPQATGIQKRLKRAIMYPTGISSQTLGPNDTFRFVMNAQEFLDPLSTCLKFQVSVPTATLQDSTTSFNYVNFAYRNNLYGKAIQLDSSAQSFISSFKAFCGVGGEYLEIIEQYDVVACFLNDVGTCNPGSFRTIDYTGVGGAYGSHFNNISTVVRGNTTQVVPAFGGIQPYANGSTSSSTSAQNATAYNQTPYNSASQGTYKNTVPTLFYDPTREYQYTFDMRFAMPSDGVVSADVEAPYFPEGIAGPRKFKGNRCTVTNHILHDMPTMGFDTAFGDGYSYSGNNVNVSVGSGTVGTNSTSVANSVYGNTFDDPNQDVGKYGNSLPFPVNFGKTTFEPIFSNQNQKVILNGVPSMQPITTMTFIIPLLSGVFGSLMQPSNYKLIPMAAFQNLTFEFKLNPYALFTSWSSTSFTDRSYSITAMELHMDLIEFMDLNVIDATNEALRQGFVLCTQSYMFGPEYAFSGSNVPRNLQINMGFDSMRSLFMVIYDQAYKTNTMFRKHYRLSANISSMQMKIGTEYFPQQPIVGAAGSNFGSVNNYDFYINMLKCFNKMNIKEEIGINIHNFAINWRELYYAYQVGGALNAIDGKTSTTAVNPSAPSLTNVDETYPGYVLQGNIILIPSTEGDATFNSYPAMVCNSYQLGFYFENRVIGKALFGISCTPANYENNMLEGKNTTIARPFDLLLNTSGSYTYSGNSALMIFIYYDLIISFSNGTVRALGKS